jgi:alpha-D-xyloside xylohydrolase
MSGFPYWTTDVGGFFRSPDQYASTDYHELLIRWFEFGTFCPIFRVHGYQSKTEMWNYGPEVEKILTQYDELRYRLMPYIYSAAWGVTNRGETIMQALPFVYPNDLALRDADDEFLFGNSLLVNPVTKPNATSRSVVLPEGNDWVDFWSGKTHHGGQTIMADAPLDETPIFIKEGSIVPMGPVVQSTAEAQDPLEIRIYGGKDADFQLYQDSGDGYAYEHGARATIHLHWDDRRNMLSIGDRAGAFPGMPGKQTFQIVLVKEAHGIGMRPESGPDRTATYTGHQMTIRLSKAG